MSQTHFYHKLLRKYQTIIGHVFKNFYVYRDNQPLLVPVSFSPKDKLIQRYLRREESLKGVSMTLPRIGYELSNPVYDSQRKLNRLHKIIINESISSHDREIVYTPVPYNIPVIVSVLTNRTDDACEIAEQIIPIFTPDLKISAKNLIDDSQDIWDLSLNLDSINIIDNNEGELKQRLIQWDFYFTLKTWFFKDVQNENYIHEVIANFFAGTIDDNYYIDNVSVTTDDL